MWDSPCLLSGPLPRSGSRGCRRDLPVSAGIPAAGRRNRARLQRFLSTHRRPPSWASWPASRHSGWGSAHSKPRADAAPGAGRGRQRAPGGNSRSARSFDEGTQLILAVARVPDQPNPEARFRTKLFGRGVLPRLRPGQRVPLVARASDRRGSLQLGRARPLRPVAPAGRSPSSAASTPAGWWCSPRRGELRSSVKRPAREALAARVYALAPTREAAALYLTLAAGLRATLGEALEEAFLAGGGLVLSVSGLHVAALAEPTLKALRFLLVRTLRRARGRRRPAVGRPARPALGLGLRALHRQPAARGPLCGDGLGGAASGWRCGVGATRSTAWRSRRSR